jgi:beta-glucosidase
MKLRILYLLVLMPFVDFAQSKQIPVYKDPSAPVEARVQDLLKRMTLSEKIAQDAGYVI